MNQCLNAPMIFSRNEAKTWNVTWKTGSSATETQGWAGLEIVLQPASRDSRPLLTSHFRDDLLSIFYPVDEWKGIHEVLYNDRHMPFVQQTQKESQSSSC